MKRVCILIISISIWSALQAQDFKVLHRISLPFAQAGNHYRHSDDFRFFLCPSEEEMLMADGITGKKLWHIRFEKSCGEKRIRNYAWNREANVILLYNEDSRTAFSEKYFIDGETGELLWKTGRYASEMGNYRIDSLFTAYVDTATDGSLFVSEAGIDFTDIFSGRVIWSHGMKFKSVEKHFGCQALKSQGLVRVSTGKKSFFWLTAREGKMVTDAGPRFNKLKHMNEGKHVKMLQVPEKNMYIVMQGESSVFYTIMGADMPRWKMDITAYEEGTDRVIWSTSHSFAYIFTWISLNPLVRLYYADGYLFIEHEPALKKNDGLTVLDIHTGELLWKADYTCSELKSSTLDKSFLTPFPAPDPVVWNQRVYVVDKVNNRLACYDARAGSLVWESGKLPPAQKIPAIYLTDSTVVIQYGGDGVKDVSTGDNGGPVVYTKEYSNWDRYGMAAYDLRDGRFRWNTSTIAASAGDAFKFIAGTFVLGNRLYCATDANLFILDPDKGEVLARLSLADAGMDEIWKMFYFADRNKIILNSSKGIIKVEPESLNIMGMLVTSNVPSLPAHLWMNYDDAFDDYAIFIKGDAGKMDYKKFASIDLEKMAIRGTDDADILLYDDSHFSAGGELFYMQDGTDLIIYSVKQ